MDGNPPDVTGQPPLDPWRFDALTGGPEKIWGLEDIATALGVSVSTARRWAKDPAVPIYKPEGTGMHFARRSELRVWLRGKAA